MNTMRHNGTVLRHQAIIRKHLGLTLLALTLPLAGCLASNRIVGNNIVQAGDWYGELGITGHLNQITVQAPSDLTKLSVIGDANVVNVMPHVTLGKVEVWGQRNKIYIPARLIIRSHIIGDGSEIIRLQPGQTTPSLPAEGNGTYNRPLANPPTEPQPLPPSDYEGGADAQTQSGSVRLPVTYQGQPAGYSSVTIEEVP